jgi:transcription-repair coupling factor (superfamily II helicase)
MNLSCLLPLLEETTAYKQLVNRLLTTKNGHKAAILDAAKPYLIAALHGELGLPLVVITAQPEKAHRLYEQLQIWCSPSTNLHLFPELDFLPYEYLSSYSANAMWERLQALATLALYEDGAKPPLIVTSALAMVTKTISQKDFTAACQILRRGMTIEPLSLLRRWQFMGYEAENIVEVPGTMCRRGGIIDIFSPCSRLPARIEFVGNQIESIRLFQPESQCSSELVSLVAIAPAKELLIPDEKYAGTLNLDNCSAEIKQRLQDDIVKLEQGQWFPSALFYFPLFNKGSILDYLDDNAILILDTPGEIETTVKKLCHEVQELRKAKLKRGGLPQNLLSPYFSWGELEPKINTGRRLSLEPWNVSENELQSLPFTLASRYGGKLEKFLRAAEQILREKRRLLIVSHQANRLAELFQEKGMPLSPVSELKRIPPPGSITLLQSLPGETSKSLPSEGWEMNKLHLVTDAELFGFVKQTRLSKKVPVRRRWLIPQLVPGDYIVHVDHGIGKFKGLTRMSVNGIEQEYLVLEYAKGDRLYVPTNQIARVSPYIGAGERTPSLSRLGTQEWERIKKRVKESVADIAQEMLALYASRELNPGFAFPVDTLWQQELEASFPYVETPDQVEAIIAVKKDMENPKSMDRLICGDVGYGKTEIALRAAFKAVMDSRQVAILVPTTVLAQQHFTTFRERLQTFPMRVEMLSRFCSQDKEREILAGLSSGIVDICIGTHRLLQKDVTFKDLGLVMIDEEQRFGVIQKEKLKQMRKEVDVLTLSATPIPRTLHMSLTGVRDMSIMETPPEERLSIKTYVGPYDEQLVRQAILRELERNGQVFFVHNRIGSIAIVASELQALIPEARIAIAHGQMPEEELEEVMLQFVAGSYDVLITTTIIESGLDMPNVNTLIVDQSDKLGLAQLYQLRGRVGRGSKQAYAYFLFDRDKQLTSQAYKRLKTIFEASELGAGFSIAVKDLEIRGAGNLLGVKQSGHIAAVGFDLYCQLLAEAVEELKRRQSGEAKKAKLEFTPSISLPLTAFIPEEYIPDLDTRLGLYRRLARIEYEQETEDMAQELRDRFGDLPGPVRNLLYIVEIKTLAIVRGIQSIYAQGKQVVLDLAPGRNVSPLPSGYKYKKAVRIGTRQIRLDVRRLGNKWQEALEDLLQNSANY